jgi:hypothetical protein
LYGDLALDANYKRLSASMESLDQRHAGTSAIIPFHEGAECASQK